MEDTFDVQRATEETWKVETVTVGEGGKSSILSRLPQQHAEQDLLDGTTVVYVVELQRL